MSLIVARESTGLSYHRADNTGITQIDSLACPNVKASTFSSDGRYLAYADGTSVVVRDMQKKQTVHTYNKPRCSKLAFSPKGSVLVMFENYQVTKDQAEGTPNLILLNTSTGEVIRSFVHKKMDSWCPQWSCDEMLCCRTLTSEIHVYKDNIFHEQHCKLVIKELQMSALVKFKDTYHLAVYIPGNKASPSAVRIFRHNMAAGGFDANARPVANKSFFRADSVRLFWNCLGSDLLVLTSCDVSQESYYGEQGLHYMTTSKDGESSCVVPLKKRGPIYSVEWQPITGKVFVVCHGYYSPVMPANTVVYNLKCDPIHEFGILPRNITYFNPHGTILCVAGFEALKGEIDVWDFQKKTRITQLQAPNTTQFSWAPDGEHFVTATTAPRLRVNNGVRLWHFTGRLIGRHEVSHGNTLGGAEMYEVLWQPRNCPQPPNLLYKAWDGNCIRLLESERAVSALSTADGESASGTAVTTATTNSSTSAASSTSQILRTNPQGPQTEKSSMKSKAANVYVPPHLRKSAPNSAGSSASGVGGDSAMKTPTKPRKSKSPGDDSSPPLASSQYDFKHYDLSGDPEQAKKIKNVLKKLQAIEKLKEKQDRGDKLELNQVEKIRGEDALLTQLKDLTLK